LPPLPLASALLTHLPWLSAQGRAAVNIVVCDNGRPGSADLVASRLGLRTRFQLARLLRREGLPPYDALTGWTTVLYWMLEADRTGMTLLALARRSRLDPAVSYRTIRRLTGFRWSELRQLGTADVLRRFLRLCRPARTTEPGRGRPLTPKHEHQPPEWSSRTGAALPLRLPLPGAPFAVALRGRDMAYVTRSHAAAVERLDLATGRFVGSIPVGCIPTCVTFDRAGTRAYVSIQYGDSIAVIDAATHTTVGILPVPGDPFPVLLGPSGHVLYVTTNEDRLYALSLGTERVIASVPLPATSHSLALHPSGTRLYVATRAGGTVLEVDTLRHQVTRTFVTGGQPQGLAVSSDGRFLYAANERDGLNVVCLATGEVLRTLDVGGAGVSLALSPDERLLCVGLVFAGAVAVVDRTSLTLRTTVRTGGRPRGIAFDPTGRLMIIANESGWVDLLPGWPPALSSASPSTCRIAATPFLTV
jgi:DNA-binding beta-propeller fold protein YncE